MFPSPVAPVVGLPAATAAAVVGLPAAAVVGLPAAPATGAHDEAGCAGVGDEQVQQPAIPKLAAAALS